MRVPTMPVTCDRTAPSGACASVGSIGRMPWIMASASSIACVASWRHCVTMPMIDTGRLPMLRALSRLVTSVASPAPSEAMIEATIGWTLTGTSSSRPVRIVRICILPASVGWIAPAIGACATPSSTRPVRVSSSVSYCVPASVSA